MFRHLALAWHASGPLASAHVDRLAQELQTWPDWRAVVDRPGLRVYATGVRPGINAVQLIGEDADPDRRGVLLGQLFRRSDLGQTLIRPPSSKAMTPDEGAQILHSAGRALVSHWWGRYIAFLPTASGSTRVLRDPTLPCYWLAHEGVSLVVSWLEDASTPETTGLALSSASRPIKKSSLNSRSTSQVLRSKLETALHTHLQRFRPPLVKGEMQMLRSTTSGNANASTHLQRAWSHLRLHH